MRIRGLFRANFGERKAFRHAAFTSFFIGN